MTLEDRMLKVKAMQRDLKKKIHRFFVQYRTMQIIHFRIPYIDQYILSKKRKSGMKNYLDF
jgi:hypothetical protein